MKQNLHPNRAQDEKHPHASISGNRLRTRVDGDSPSDEESPDAVGEVIETSATDIDPPPAFGTRIRVDYLSGMVRNDRKFVLILDIDRVLSVDELLSVGLLSEAQPTSPAPGSPPQMAGCESGAEGRTS